MNFFRYYSFKELVKLIESIIWKGLKDLCISSLNEIHRIKKGDLLFVDHPKYYDRALQSEVIGLIIDKEIEIPREKRLILSENYFCDFDNLICHFFLFQKDSEYVSKKSYYLERVLI